MMAAADGDTDSDYLHFAGAVITRGLPASCRNAVSAAVFSGAESVYRFIFISVQAAPN